MSSQLLSQLHVLFYNENRYGSKIGKMSFNVQVDNLRL